jgi:hypothetical protein
VHAAEITEVSYSAVGVRKGWDTFWGAISGPAGPILDVLAVIGVLFIIAAVASYIWKKARNRGGSLGGVFLMLVIGLFLITPSVIIPILASAADVVLNVFVSLADRFY